MPATPAEAIARGVDYLLGMQDAAGGWRRSRYGALRGGAALTALSLRVLSGLVEPEQPAAADRRSVPALAAALREPLAAAVQFLRPGVERRGAIACPDGTLDLPVYATALALLAEAPARPLWTPAERQRMRNYLLAAQITPARGFGAADSHLGGWDLGSAPPPRAITTGTNISLTAWTLQALTRSTPPPAAPPNSALPPAELPNSASPNSAPPNSAPPPVWRDLARAWLERCQNRPGDGGFVFTPDRSAVDNKAGIDPATSRPRSYGTATCDGLLALAACHARPAENPPSPSAGGDAPVDPAWTAALGWFARLEAWEEAPGGPPALWFYWAARLTEASAYFPGPRREAARDALAAALVARQRADGSWANTEPAMREDDPLIATPLAIAALGGLN